MNTKPSILIFIDWFLPGYKAGGPIKSVSNIINTLNNEFNFYIITSDRDLNDPNPYQGVKLNDWINNETHSIIYLSPNIREKWITQHLAKNSYQYYYFNSIFSKHFTLSPLLTLKKMNLSNKIILAPRGMLGKGALSIKPLKKKLFLFMAKLFGYFKNIIWHATNKEEQNDIIAIFGSSITSKIASNISFSKIIQQPLIKESGYLKLVFFSRISPKKNLYYALELLKTTPNIELSIYGSIEDINYWGKCENLISNYKINASYKGELHPQQVQETLANYHFFILPTLHENYGHVIVEALVSGCGLIISNNTPWIDISNKKIGWDIDLSQKENFLMVIKECLVMNQQEYNTYRNNCYTFVEKEVNSLKEIEATKEMFNS